MGTIPYFRSSTRWHTQNFDTVPLSVRYCFRKVRNLNFAPIDAGSGNFDNGFEISRLILGGVLVMLYYEKTPPYPTFRKRDYAHHITVPPSGSGFAAPGGTQKFSRPP